MEIEGKVIQVLDTQRGTSARTGKEWALKTFIIETQEQYPRKVAIEIFGEDRIKDNPVSVDQLVTAFVDIESREASGRWYTSVRAWKVKDGVVEQKSEDQPAEQSPTTTPPPVEPFDPAPPTSNGELPF